MSVLLFICFAAKQSLEDKPSQADHHQPMDTSALSSSAASDEGGSTGLMLAAAAASSASTSRRRRRRRRRRSKLDDIDEDEVDEEAEYEGGGEYGDEDMADEEGGDPLREEDMDEDTRATAEAILNIEARLDKAISDVNAMTVDRLANNLSKTFVSDAGDPVLEGFHDI